MCKCRQIHNMSWINGLAMTETDHPTINHGWFVGRPRISHFPQHCWSILLQTCLLFCFERKLSAFQGNPLTFLNHAKSSAFNENHKNIAKNGRYTFFCSIQYEVTLSSLCQFPEQSLVMEWLESMGTILSLNALASKSCPKILKKYIF